MKNLILIFFCTTFWSLSAFCQQFSYSFEGQLPGDKQVEIIHEINNLIGVEKVVYKEKAEKGELVFLVDMSKENDKEETFSANDVKRILIQFNLQPLTFNKLD